jgi:hypothetical protein
MENEQQVGLSEAASFLLDECRMVLPGIQALFGFQLIAVFNQRFADELSRAEQSLHFAAIGLLGIAIALVMTPAALHRQMGVRNVSVAFLTISSRLLLASMFPLALAFGLDFYLIARIILGQGPAPLFGTLLVGVFAVLWLLLPRSRRLLRILSH